MMILQWFIPARKNAGHLELKLIHIMVEISIVQNVNVILKLINSFVPAVELS